MAHHGRVRRNASRRQPYAWLGASAVGVGLALAGAGTAHADDTSAAAETSSARVSSSAAAAPGGSAAAPRSVAAVRTAGPGRSAAAASRAVRANQPLSAAAAADRFTPARVAAVAGRRVPGVAVGAAVSSAVAASAPTAAAAAGAVTPAPSKATIAVTPAPSKATIAVTNWFSSTRGWLNGFDGSLAGAVQDVLYGVQRTLFSPAPTVKPIQYSTWTPGEPILGALRYVQPGGAAVGMQLTQAPTLGTVQLLSSGAYTYTPGPDFTGTDSFTAEVTAGGFNLLEPFTPRPASVVVNINPGPPVQLTQGFDITNLSARGVYLTEIKKERGYEDSVDSPPVNTALQPGETFHVELTQWAFYDYTTYFLFTGCEVARCDLLPFPSGQEWTVQLDLFETLLIYSRCLGAGYCTDEKGKSLNYPGNYGLSLVNLVDTKGPPKGATVLTSGAVADRVEVRWLAGVRGSVGDG